MPEESFLEDAIRSRGFFPLVGDLRLVSEVEDLDLPTGRRERLTGVEGFEDTLPSGATSPILGSGQAFSEMVSAASLSSAPLFRV